MSAIAQHPHRVTTAIAGVRSELASVTDAPVWSMDATETTATLAEIQSAKAQLAELEARLLVHADRTDLAGQAAASSTARWHAHATTTTRAAAHRLMWVAHELDSHETTRDALASGRVNAEQVEVILRALDALPADVDADVVERAEQHLLELAAEHDAKALRLLGRRILEVVSPETADAHEARLLEREERAAQAATRLTMWDDGHGQTHGRFTVDTALTGAALKKALWAIAAPKHQASQGPLGDRGERRPTPERLGQAFSELILRYPATRLPKAGGLNATVVVTMTLDTLMGGLKAAHLDTGETISAGAARRLACDALIVPVVLDGKSEVLDVGRGRRFATEPQRIAKIAESRGRCQTESCDNPATHLHHPIPWSQGGPTDLANLAALCPWHHHRAHDTSYEMTKLPTGHYTFHRRQ